MALKLMYITNDPEVARIAEENGVDRIFVDMEYIGKKDRQGGMDTVQSKHTIDDVKKIRAVINESELLVRCNPIHEGTEEYSSSEQEINEIVDAGADVIMLPFFKTPDEVQRFLACVNKRCRTLLLLETKEAVENLDEILRLSGIDEIHIGLNDLHLSYGLTFMFELLTNGVVENICKKIAKTNIIYGFGGIACIGEGLLPAECIVMEHYRLGSQMVILSRSFCNARLCEDMNQVEKIFTVETKKIRNFESGLQNIENEIMEKNLENIKEIVTKIKNNIILVKKNEKTNI